jgi:superfamily II DNA/RNA helicase
LLHGEQKGQHRAAALAKFNIGKLNALVTSDAFGLGIDYQGVDVVLCLDEAARTAQAYVARCAGRASRHRSSKLPRRKKFGGFIQLTLGLIRPHFN